MNSLSRALLLSAVLLAVFLLAAFSLQAWLARQAAAVRAESAAKASRTLEAAIALAPREPAAWDDAYRARLGEVIGGEVRLLPRDQGLPRGTFANDQVVFTLPFPGADDWNIIGATTALPGARWQTLHQRTLAAIVMLALLLAVVPVVTALMSSRRAERETRAPWEAARAEAAGLEQFARLTVEPSPALERELGARLRAEQDLDLSRSLLDRSLEERIRLGRELHDNVSQTLYAVTLSLESVRRKMTAAPEIEQRLDTCTAELRRLNQEVRAYLRDLEPESMQRASFALALAEMLGAATAANGVRIEQRLDDDAVELIPAQQTADLVNIVREAISNSVRHGKAQRITVRAARGENAIALVIADDGTGFVPAAQGASRGHGLGNMQARAAALGAALQIDSAPGKGTRVLLTLPFDSSRS